MKLTRYQKSMNEHYKLRQKAADMPGKNGELRYAYHDTVIRMQKKDGRVMSKKDRGWLWNSLKKTIFGG